ncbi:globin domain-containing protein [Nocardia terpenica]|uniref:nitric oxide dioxygenase n=1 Tax=Nocardia terpenica TaxID=455432 RepID=A0A6G9YUX7_9NOCA|nr:globin domain-containing protein [Nocardia terpenica]QIS17139.1 hemin transporter [Nocardia terpenica]
MTITPDHVRETATELDSATTEIIRATLPLIGGRIDEITALFYRRMFAAHPELARDRFNRGNQRQGSQQRALAASIATFAAHLVDATLPDPRRMLARIGHKHASLGVTAGEYRIVHRYLFAAIVEVLGAQVVTDEAAAAWDRVYWLMADTLIDLEHGLYERAGVRPGDVFREARVVEREEDPAGSLTLVLESANPAEPLPGFLPGQYISVAAELPDGARQLRQYSLTGDPGRGRLGIAVRRVLATDHSPEGEVSAWLHDTVAVGDRLQITLPFGDLVLDTAAETPVVLVSAGIGVTPMVGMLEYLVAAARARRTVVLHADRSADTHPLRLRVRRLIGELTDATYRTWYEDRGDGRIDLTGVDLPADADFYLCGGAGFLQSVRAQLATAGIPDHRVHFELFTPNDWLVHGR